MRLLDIKNGTVIDHLPPGTAFKISRLLKLEGYNDVIGLLINVESTKYGKKDLIKMEGRGLSEEEINRVALFAPNATINIIRNSKVIKKVKIRLPDTIRGILTCPNPNCITNKPRENVENIFHVISRNPLKMMCHYCERTITPEYFKLK